LDYHVSSIMTIKDLEFFDYIQASHLIYTGQMNIPLFLTKK